MWGGGSVAENGVDTRRDIKSGWVQQNRPKGVDGAQGQSIQPELSRDMEEVQQIIPKLLAPKNFFRIIKNSRNLK